MNTPRFALPLLSVAQAHKELIHNEALFLLDTLLQPVVESRTNAAPVNLGPADAGKCWVVGIGGVGTWMGRDSQIACWTGDDWRFVLPVNHMQIYVTDSGVCEKYINNQWVVPPIIGSPTGGSVIDGEARSAVSALLTYLRTLGILKV